MDQEPRLTDSYVASTLSESDFRVVAPDIIGFGYSNKPTVDYTIDFFIEFLEEFFRKCAY